MNATQLAAIQRKLPLSKSTLARNQVGCVPSDTEPQCAVQDAPDAAVQGKKENSSRCRVSIVSYRKRLIDPDNLCPKHFIDSLRYLKIIEDDSAKHIVLEMRQEKSKTPRTEIEITPLE